MKKILFIIKKEDKNKMNCYFLFLISVFELNKSFYFNFPRCWFLFKLQLCCKSLVSVLFQISRLQIKTDTFYILLLGDNGSVHYHYHYHQPKTPASSNGKIYYC